MIDGKRKYSRILLWLSGILLWTGVSGPAYAADKEASFYYLEGVKEQALDEWEKALNLYRYALKLDPQHAPSLYRLADLARMGNDIPRALEYSRRAHLADTSYIPYADSYARILALAGEYATADSLFTVLSAKEPAEIDYRSMLAVIRLDQNQPREALAAIDTIEIQAGIRPQLVDIKRQALIRLERYREAYNYMVQVNELVPGEPTFRVQLAELAASLRMDSIALANYHAAIELDSTNFMPRLSLAEYYRIKGMPNEHIRSLIPVFAHPAVPVEYKVEYAESYLPGQYPPVLAALMMEQGGENAQVQNFYISSLLQSGRHDDAHDYFAEKIRSGRADPATYQGIVQLAHFRGQPDTVEHYLALAGRAFPRDPDLGLTTLFIRLQQSDTVGAVAKAQELIRWHKNDSVAAIAYTFCGDIAYQQGNSKEAFKAYEKALKIRPDDAVVLNNYAYYMSLQNRGLQQALEMSERANLLHPHNATYLDTKAWILYMLGRYEEAQEVMRQALVLDTGNNAEILLHYGDILDALDRRFMAETYWKKALEAGADAALIERRLDSTYR